MPDLQSAHFHAGFARVDITPPVGFPLSGYAVREGGSKSVDMPLSLSAVTVREGQETVVILAADLCMIDVPFATELRRACASAVGIEPHRVLLNVSHSHSAPGIGSYVEFGSPREMEERAAYWKAVVQAAVNATLAAVAALQPARFAVGWGECRGNVNRRQKMPDGTVLLGEDLQGVCDSSVGVWRIDDMNGTPLVVVFRYSCHTVTLGPKTNRISPDFAGPARELIESALNCPSLFLQGCAGNINPATGIGQDADDSPFADDDKTRLGQMLGAEVIKVAQSLRTNRRRAEPTLVESVARYWLYSYEQVPEGEPAKITATEASLTLPLTPFPDFVKVEEERAEWAEKLKQARDSGRSEWSVAPLVRFDYWAQKRMACAQVGINPATVTFPLQRIRIGPLQIVAIPFEVMSETGTSLRETFGSDTFVLGFSNGIVSYLPTPEISQEGGMEAKLGYKAYLIPSEVPGDWEPLIRKRISRV